MGSDDLIRVENLKKRYGDFAALKGISFTVKRGEIVGFLGPNGAGKTTTMKIVTGYIPATAGTVCIDGMNIFHHSQECRQKIGYLPEDVPLYDDMRVTSYLSYVCELRGIKKSDIPFKIDKIVEECNLEPVKDKLIKQLSKGNRQRAGLAQALIHEPEILILDEPTIGLDPKQVVTIRELIKRLGENQTVILSTHILPEVEQMCDRVIIINEGEIVLDKRFEEFENETNKVYVLHIKGDVNEVEAFLKEAGTVDATDSQDTHSGIYTVTITNEMSPEKLARGIIERKWDLCEMRKIHDTLEAVFLKVTMS